MANGTRTRRDVWALSSSNPWPPMLLEYAKAVRAMQPKPGTDPTSWAYQAAIHGTTAKPPRGARWNECKHGSWFFLPWHRLYVEHFERIVRSVVVAQWGDANWSLPYWNFEAPRADALPPAFRATTLPDGTPNPLLVAQRAPGMNAGGRLPVARLSSRPALEGRTFTPPPGAGFGGGLSGPLHFASAYGDIERTPHNDIHVLVGGTGLMGDPDRAALDPIFWLHHANIDRLWSEWIALGAGRTNPPDRAWRSQRFPLVDERGATVQRTVTQSLTTQGLGYTYDTLAAVTRPPGPTREKAGPGRDDKEAAVGLVGASKAPVVLAGRATSVEVQIDQRAAAALGAGRKATAAAAPGRVYLSLDDIQGERNPGTVYELHLMGAAGATKGKAADRYIGNVSFFGIEQVARSDADHAHGMRHLYDVTDLVSGLQASGAWDDRRVRVEFRPLGLLPPEGATAKAVQDDAPADKSPADQRSVRIGRVGLFFE